MRILSSVPTDCGRMYSYGSIAAGTPPVAYSTATSSSTEVRQTYGPSIRDVPKTAMGFHPTNHRHHPHSPTLASRSQLCMAVDRPVSTLLRISFKWPVSRCRISPWVCPQRCLSYRVFNEHSVRFMRSTLRWLLNSTCIGIHGPRLESTVFLRYQVLLAGPVQEERLGSATHGLLSHALPERDRSKTAGIRRDFHSRFVKVQHHWLSELIMCPRQAQPSRLFMRVTPTSKIFPRASPPIGPLPSRT